MRINCQQKKQQCFCVVVLCLDHLCGLLLATSGMRDILTRYCCCYFYCSTTQKLLLIQLVIVIAKFRVRACLRDRTPPFHVICFAQYPTCCIVVVIIVALMLHISTCLVTHITPVACHCLLPLSTQESATLCSRLPVSQVVVVVVVLSLNMYLCFGC